MAEKVEEGPKYRLKAAHYIKGDKYLEADTLVGWGTPHEIDRPTIEMEPLNSAAEDAIAAEEERLRVSHGSMTPENSLPLTVGQDDYDERFVPGFGTRRQPKT